MGRAVGRWEGGEVWGGGEVGRCREGVGGGEAWGEVGRRAHFTLQ